MNELIEGLKDWLADEIKRQQDEIKETRHIAPNSFGMGYEVGYMEALVAVEELIEEGFNE